MLMKALSDDTRVKIFDMLSKGEICAFELLEEFNITQPTLSYHMKILCDCGLVVGHKDGVRVKYSININNLDSLKNYLCLVSIKIHENIEEY